MNPQLRKYLLAKPAAEEYFPFEPGVPVFKVVNKIFALCFTRGDRQFINLKCRPDYAEQLRSLFKEVQPGYHMNKKHWNSVEIGGKLPLSEVFQQIDHSYLLVAKSLPKVVKQRLRLQYAGLAEL